MKIIQFQGVQALDVEHANNLRENFDAPPVEPELESNSMLDAIFAPDPITGNPSSDLFVQIQDPSIRDYISRELQSFYMEDSKTDDATLALESAKSRFERAQDYANRLKEYIKKTSESK